MIRSGIPFAIGFTFTLLAFFVLNYVDYSRAWTGYLDALSRPVRFDHMSWQFGLPFRIYRGGTCYPCYDFGFLLFGIFADLFVASAAGGLAGVLLETRAGFSNNPNPLDPTK